MTRENEKKKRKGLFWLLFTTKFWTEKWYLIPAIAVFLAGITLIWGLDLLGLRGGIGGNDLAVKNVELVQDPVCGEYVDPNETPYKCTYMGTEFYFDSQECLDTFLANPLAYLKMRLRINVAMRGENPAEGGTTSPDGPGRPRTTTAMPVKKAAPKKMAATSTVKPRPVATPKTTLPPVKPSPSPSEDRSAKYPVPVEAMRKPDTEPTAAPSPKAAPPFTDTITSDGSGTMTDDERQKDFLARQLVDHLYCPNKQMPIQDMLVELENYKISKEPPKDAKMGPNLFLSSNDKIFFKSPSRLRVDSLVNQPGAAGDKGLKIVIRDGQNRWFFVSQAQYPVKKGADEPSPTLALPFNIQRYPAVDQNKKYAIVGRETVSGVTAEVVRIVDPANTADIITVWIDKTKWVPVKLEKAVPGKEKASKKKVLYKDVRQLQDGRYMPFTLEVYEGEALYTVYQFQKAAVNIGLQAALFQPMEKFIR